MVRSGVGLFIATGAFVALVIASGRVVSADDACLATFASGTGPNRMVFCVSRHGNVVRFESPAGAEHLRFGDVGEGYALCSKETESGEVHGFDAGFAESGFGAEVVSQPKGANTFPLTITRNTVDGVFQLKQTFSRDTNEKDVTITMTVTRLTASSYPGVILTRYFDGDLDNAADDDIYDLSADSVWGRDDGKAPQLEIRNALMLSVLAGSNVPPHTNYVETWADWHPTLPGGLQTARLCEIGSLWPTGGLPTAPGDYVGRIALNLGEIAVGKSKTVKMVYRRF
jgi:hypothetical protein